MNFLILGEEIPDYSHPVLNKHKIQQEDSNRPLSEDERLIKAVRILQSSSYASDVEKLRLYYKEKAFRLKVIFDMYLKNHGILNMPSGGLAIWIALKQPMLIWGISDSLTQLGVFDTKLNPQLKPDQPVVGIRIGFGKTKIEIFEEAFQLLATHFKSEALN